VKNRKNKILSITYANIRLFREEGLTKVLCYTMTIGFLWWEAYTTILAWLVAEFV
jgi:hypothetical protein